MPYIIKNVDDGYKVCKKNYPSKCFSNKPLTKKRAEKQKKAIEINENLKGGIEINDIKKLVNKVKKIVSGLKIVGSIARKEKEINDIDIITKNNLQNVIKKLQNNFNVEIIKNGTKHISIKINNIKLDFWKALNNDELKYMVIMRTIDKQHNIAYKKLAKKLNMKLNDKGLFKNNIRVPFKNEEQLRKLLNVGLNGNGNKKISFKQFLKNNNIDPDEYLYIIKERAKKFGYDPNKINFSDDTKHKLMYDNTKFGANGMNDFIIYLFKVVDGKINKEFAFKRRKAYRARAYNTMKKTNNKFSPASLSYYLIW